jgi:hypothetical protein
MTTRELLADRVAREMRERAASGEPEPGVYGCLRCGRDDCRMYTVVLDARGTVKEMGDLNLMDGWMRSRPHQELQGRLICPCCSFKDCPHREPAEVAS